MINDDATASGSSSYLAFPGIWAFRQFASALSGVPLDELARLFPSRPVADARAERSALAARLAIAAQFDEAFADLGRALSRFENLCRGDRWLVAFTIRLILDEYERNQPSAPRLQNVLLLDAFTRGLDRNSIREAAVRSGILRGGDVAKSLADRRTTTRREIHKHLGVPLELVDQWVTCIAAWLVHDETTAPMNTKPAKRTPRARASVRPRAKAPEIPVFANRVLRRRKRSRARPPSSRALDGTSPR